MNKIIETKSSVWVKISYTSKPVYPSLEAFNNIFIERDNKQLFYNQSGQSFVGEIGDYEYVEIVGDEVQYIEYVMFNVKSKNEKDARIEFNLSLNELNQDNPYLLFRDYQNNPYLLKNTSVKFEILDFDENFI